MPEEPQPWAVQVSLAEIKRSMEYLQRDLTEIKSQYITEVQRVKDRVDAHQTALDRMDGALRIIARAQTILYFVFFAGFAFGIYAALHKS